MSLSVTLIRVMKKRKHHPRMISLDQISILTLYQYRWSAKMIQ